MELQPEGWLMKMPPRPAAAFSFHPDPRLKNDPKYQTNRPGNAHGLMPEQLQSSNPYGDGVMVRSIDGVNITPAAQQQIVVHPAGSKPGGDNPVIPGHPEQIAPTKLLEQLGSPLRTTTTAMAASQQRPMGDAEAATRRGIPGPLAMGGLQRPTGRDTRKMRGFA
jgi:hypothetical protein